MSIDSDQTDTAHLRPEVSTVDDLARLLAAHAAKGQRFVCALVGAPASGKSALAERLVERINGEVQDGSPPVAALLPMDGFHFDDLYLQPAGLRPRKGAPETFDVGGLRHTLRRLRAADEPFVAVPVFDRSLEVARAGARLIPAEVPLIICEGNWLLLNQEPWAALRPLFDLTVMVEVPEDELRRRLRGRWESYGLRADEVIAKVEGNDLPNGRLVYEASHAANYTISGTSNPQNIFSTRARVPKEGGPEKPSLNVAQDPGRIMNQ